MCGFHGSTSGQAIGRPALSHRGPDHYAQFKAGSVVLEHWRLSIIDLSENGNQPMAIGDDIQRLDGEARRPRRPVDLLRFLG